jgi:RNA polymerase sigma factor (TIGR02999 family)
MNDVTRIVVEIGHGDAAAADKLLPLVYDELRRLAAARLRQEPPGQTLEATALVHEAYLRLVGPDPGKAWEGRGHFFAAAAEAMRRILIERARHRARHRHGGGRERVPLERVDLPGPDPSPDDRLLELDAALERFAAEEPEKAQLVRLRYFAGLKLEDAAEMLGISRATAARHWRYARAWLYHAIEHDRPDAAPPDGSEQSPH